MKFKFELEIGCLYRKEVRNSLLRAKDKLEYEYIGSSLKIREEKTWLDSVFYIQGTNFPDTVECQNLIKNWFNKFADFADENENE